MSDGGAVGASTTGGAGFGAGAGAENPPPGVHDEADTDGFHSPAEGFMMMCGSYERVFSWQVVVVSFWVVVVVFVVIVAAAAIVAAAPAAVIVGIVL